MALWHCLTHIILKQVVFIHELLQYHFSQVYRDKILHEKKKIKNALVLKPDCSCYRLAAAVAASPFNPSLNPPQSITSTLNCFSGWCHLPDNIVYLITQSNILTRLTKWIPRFL